MPVCSWPTSREVHFNRAADEPTSFFGLSKDADSDIPILQQAKAEYAKLE
jgi:hypothetical protein